MDIALAYNEINLKKAINFVLSLDGVDYNEILQTREITEDEFKEALEMYFSTHEAFRYGQIT